MDFERTAAGVYKPGSAALILARHIGQARLLAQTVADGEDPVLSCRWHQWPPRVIKERPARAAHGPGDSIVARGIDKDLPGAHPAHPATLYGNELVPRGRRGLEIKSEANRAL